VRRLGGTATVVVDAEPQEAVMSTTHARSAEAALAALPRASGWVNSPPLTPADLRGRVVLVGFWTYTCINWLRTLPYLRDWARRYADAGLLVLGVHTPEFDFEEDEGNVRRAVADLSVGYPVALDPGYAIWDAFGNRYWPALYLIDAGGRLRYHHAGEGDAARAERAIQDALADAGSRDAGRGASAVDIDVDAVGAEVAADWENLGSAEAYLGYARTEHFASRGGLTTDARQVYSAPDRLRRGHWALAGDWTVRQQAAVLNVAGGRLAHRFHARDVHLVMAPVVRGGPVPFHVTLDGLPPAAAHGTDTDAAGDGVVTGPRLYQLIRQPGPVADRTVEITFPDAGIGAYALTFG
jgi:thiol-disulfide isomerase/thioredoxin